MPSHDRACERYEPAGILVHPAPPQQSGHKVVTLYASYNLKTTKDMKFFGPRRFGDIMVFFKFIGKFSLG